MVTDTVPPPVAVVGAGGFVGKRLADTLELAGVPAARITRSTPLISGGRLTPAIGQAEVIFYLATSINPALAERDPERVAADRAAFTALLEGVRRTPRRPALILTGSAGAVYDPAGAPPYRETDPTRPTSAYGRAKLDLEWLLFGARDAVYPMVLRIANAYGPGQRTGTMQGVIGHWLRAAAAGEPLRLYGDPETRRDYVFVDDVVEALLHASRLSRAVPGPAEPAVINIASGEPVSLTELARLVQKTVGRALPIEYLPARGFDRRDAWFEVSRADELLRWRPRISLADGVRWTWRRLAATDGITRVPPGRAGPAQSSPRPPAS